jgi:hypothetical protein
MKTNIIVKNCVSSSVQLVLLSLFYFLCVLDQVDQLAQPLFDLPLGMLAELLALLVLDEESFDLAVLDELSAEDVVAWLVLFSLVALHRLVYDLHEQIVQDARHDLEVVLDDGIDSCVTFQLTCIRHCHQDAHQHYSDVDVDACNHLELLVIQIDESTVVVGVYTVQLVPAQELVGHVGAFHCQVLHEDYERHWHHLSAGRIQ